MLQSFLKSKPVFHQKSLGNLISSSHKLYPYNDRVMNGLVDANQFHSAGLGCC